MPKRGGLKGYLPGLREGRAERVGGSIGRGTGQISNDGRKHIGVDRTIFFLRC